MAGGILFQMFGDTSGARREAGAFGDTLKNSVSVAIGNMAADALPKLAQGIDFVVDRSSELGALEQGFDSLTASLNLSGDAIRDNLRSETKGLVSDFDLIKASNEAMLLGIVQSEEQWGKLAGAAVTVGRAMGQDASTAIADVTAGIGKQSAEVLNNLGVIVRAEDAYKAYAASVGKSVDDLTAAEKQQAFTAAATESLIAKAESLGETQDALGDRITRVRTVVTNYRDDLVRWANDHQGVTTAIAGTVSSAATLAPVIGNLRTSLGDAGGLTGVLGSAKTGVKALTTSLVGKAGLVAAVGLASVWIGTKLNTALEENGWTLSNLLDKMGLYGESAGEIVQSTTDMAVAHGEAENRVTMLGSGIKHLAPELPPLAAGHNAAADGASKQAEASEKLEKALQSLGFTTQKDAIGTLDALALAQDSGEVSSEQLREKVEKLVSQYAELGILSPEVRAKLREITDELIAQGVEVDVNTRALLDYEGVLDELQASRITEWQEGWSDATGDSTDAMNDLGEATLDFVTGPPTEIPKVTSGLAGLFGELKTGIPVLDDLISKSAQWLSDMIGGLPVVGDLLGGLFGKGGLGGIVGSLFGGGEGGLAGVLGGVLGGPLGGILSGLGSKLLGSLGGILGGIFGGPDEAELEARNIINTFETEVINGILSTTQQAEAAGEQWRANNIAIRDAYLAIGASEEEAARKAAEFAEAVRKSPEEAARIRDELGIVFAEVQAAMDATGLDLTELRNEAINTANRLGISVAEAFDMLANGAAESVDRATGELRKLREEGRQTAETFLNLAGDRFSEVEAGTLGNREAVLQTRTEFENMIPTLQSLGPAGSRSAREILRGLNEAGVGGVKQLRNLAVEAGILQSKEERAAKEASRIKKAEARSAAEVEIAALDRVGNKADRVFARMAETARFNLQQIIGDFEGMEREVVGASIVPDMVDDVVGEFSRMTDDGKAELARLTRDGFEGTLAAGAERRASELGGAGRGRGGGGGATFVFSPTLQVSGDNVDGAASKRAAEKMFREWEREFEKRTRRMMKGLPVR